MADMDKFSDRLIDFAERFADVTDAAKGRGNRQGGIRARWLILPAAGIGLYALGASGTFVRGAKNVAKQAKDRATEIPDDLMTRVHQATRTTSGTSNSSSARRQPSNSRRRTATRRRRTQTTSSR